MRSYLKKHIVMFHRTLCINIVILLMFASCESKKETKPKTKYSPDTQKLAKFEPEEGKVLVFVGQDNLSVGGNDSSVLENNSMLDWDHGYIDFFENKIGIPAGLTHYIYMVEKNKKNPFGKTFKEGKIEGLNTVDEWASGDMCLRCYLSNKTNKFSKSIIHLSISMEFDAEFDIANGDSDDLIEELGDFLTEFSAFPFMLRIGYEFNGAWNNYDPEKYKESFKRIVDLLREREINNFATVMASSSMHIAESVLNNYYPGDAYVDWVGYSYFDADPKEDSPALKFAREHKKPIFIAEATPWKGTVTSTQDGAKIWNDWFKGFFEHIENNLDVIKAISYINADWRTQDMWKDSDNFNIDTRLQENEFMTKKWIEKMNSPTYIHSDSTTFEMINFSAQ